MTNIELRALLAASETSQRAMAKKLGINERTMRRWCLGQSPVPRMASYAIKWIIWKNL